VGDKAILNWESFNVGPGHSVQFQQVESCYAESVQGANFTTLNQVWDNGQRDCRHPQSGGGQTANIIPVSTNGRLHGFLAGEPQQLHRQQPDINDSFILNSSDDHAETTRNSVRVVSSRCSRARASRRAARAG
jgi:hypothetical protein